MAKEASRLIDDATMTRAVSSIVSRSEKQPDIAILERTYVDSGVLPQLENPNSQILFGRRGTGKSHVLRVLGAVADRRGHCSHVYVDFRLLGSAGMLAGSEQDLPTRCVSLFKDLLALISNHLLDLATDPAWKSPGKALEAVDALGDCITELTISIAAKRVETERSARSDNTAHGAIKIGTSGVAGELGGSSAKGASSRTAEAFDEVLRNTVVFAGVAQYLDAALEALGLTRLYLLIDEWASLPQDLQPYMAEMLKRTMLPSTRVTIKIATLEYRSTFSLPLSNNNQLGFELGGDVAADLDLDDYYVHARTPTPVEQSFSELLFKHLDAELPEGYLGSKYGIRGPNDLRSRMFTESATFVELVRAGEGVIRDFLGIFSKAYFRARREGRAKIDLSSVEEAAREWFETDKSANLTGDQEKVLQRIVAEVIGAKHARSFLVERTQANHPMIQSLFDLRVLHLWRRGYSDKERPGVRYDIYTLDYGTYVDLKRTKSMPQLELLESEKPTEGLIVPFDDKRSIRRIVLDSSILDVGAGPAAS